MKTKIPNCERERNEGVKLAIGFLGFQVMALVGVMALLGLAHLPSWVWEAEPWVIWPACWLMDRKWPT